MIQKVVNKRDLRNFSSIKENLYYWLNKTPEERVAAVDSLRKHYRGSTERLQRSGRVIKRQQFISNKRALGRKKDLADRGALGEEWLLSKPDSFDPEYRKTSSQYSYWRATSWRKKPISPKWNLTWQQNIKCLLTQSAYLSAAEGCLRTRRFPIESIGPDKWRSQRGFPDIANIRK